METAGIAYTARIGRALCRNPAQDRYLIRMLSVDFKAYFILSSQPNVIYLKLWDTLNSTRFVNATALVASAENVSEGARHAGSCLPIMTPMRERMRMRGTLHECGRHGRWGCKRIAVPLAPKFQHKQKNSYGVRRSRGNDTQKA